MEQPMKTDKSFLSILKEEDELIRNINLARKMLDSYQVEINDLLNQEKNHPGISQYIKPNIEVKINEQKAKIVELEKNLKYVHKEMRNYLAKILITI